jgi:hypothetical protein
MRTCVVEAGQRWKHFKGGIYEIVCIAARESDQQPMVVYREGSYNSTIWTRPLLEFAGEIHDIDRDPGGSLVVMFRERFTLIPMTSTHKDSQEES